MVCPLAPHLHPHEVGIGKKNMRVLNSQIVSVLIVEYGYINDDPAILRPSSGSFSPGGMYNITSVEQAGLDGYKQSVFAACCVGGGSTIVRPPFSSQKKSQRALV